MIQAVANKEKFWRSFADAGVKNCNYDRESDSGKWLAYVVGKVRCEESYLARGPVDRNLTEHRGEFVLEHSDKSRNRLVRGTGPEEKGKYCVRDVHAHFFDTNRAKSQQRLEHLNRNLRST